MAKRTAHNTEESKIPESKRLQLMKTDFDTFIEDKQILENIATFYKHLAPICFPVIGERGEWSNINEDSSKETPKSLILEIDLNDKKILKDLFLEMEDTSKCYWNKFNYDFYKSMTWERYCEIFKTRYALHLNNQTRNLETLFSIRDFGEYYRLGFNSKDKTSETINWGFCEDADPCNQGNDKVDFLLDPFCLIGIFGLFPHQYLTKMLCRPVVDEFMSTETGKDLVFEKYRRYLFEDELLEKFDANSNTFDKWTKSFMYELEEELGDNDNLMHYVRPITKEKDMKEFLVYCSQY